MPPRPTDEQIRNFIRNYHNLPQVDLQQYWRGVVPETIQHVARPIDILDTRNFTRSVTTGPTVTTALEQTFGPSDPTRALVIRSIYWASSGANPDSIEIRAQPNNIVIWVDTAPTFPAVLGNQNEPAGFASRMPIIVYPQNTILFRFVVAPAASMTFRLDITGEEWDTPIRNIGT